ncbi:MAG: ATP-binding protein, partial [Candidatus Alkanophagales archaeon]
MTKGEIIAVTGKGGTGKTLISTLLIKFLSERERILAIDADPATSLPSALGVRVQKTLGDVREEIA